MFINNYNNYQISYLDKQKREEKNHLRVNFLVHCMNNQVLYISSKFKTV